MRAASTTNTAPGSAGQNGAHTPGPWQRFDNGGTMSVDRSGTEHCYGPGYADCVWGPLGPGHGLVADCSPNGQRPTDETIANARLIAAAPQMFKALREALPTFEERAAYFGIESGPLVAIRAAIAAAAGEGK